MSLCQHCKHNFFDDFCNHPYIQADRFMFSDKEIGAISSIQKETPKWCPIKKIQKTQKVVTNVTHVTELRVIMPA